MTSKLKQSIQLAPEWILMITAGIIEHLKKCNRHTIQELHGNNALICKIHHTVRHCFNMFMRILTLKYSASFEITYSWIILEKGTLASHSLFKHKQVSEAIFSISIMDLGKMCEIQSWPATFFVVSVFTVVNQWIRRFFVFCFLLTLSGLKNHLV